MRSAFIATPPKLKLGDQQLSKKKNTICVPVFNCYIFNKNNIIGIKMRETQDQVESANFISVTYAIIQSRSLCTV